LVPRSPDASAADVWENPDLPAEFDAGLGREAAALDEGAMTSRTNAESDPARLLWRETASALKTFGGGFAAVLLVGLVLRIALALVSIGSNDIVTWRGFAAAIGEAGLLGRYGEIQVEGFVMNHPPLAVWYAFLARETAIAVGLPFALVFKLPMIVSDIALAALLGVVGGRPGRPSLSLAAAYALSPIAILVSAYHGNTDSLCAALAFLAAALLARGRHGACGLALAAALNVKLIPLLLLPALLLQCRGGAATRRFAAGLACGLLPLLPFVWAQPLAFYHATLAHGSELNHWGVTAFLHPAVQNANLKPLAAPLVVGLVDYGLYWLFAGIVGVAIAGRLRRWSPIELGAICFGLFLTIAPGFAIQYLIYVLPFLLVADFRRGLVYSSLGGLFAAVVYASYWTGTLPLFSRFHGGFPMPAPLLGVLAWAALVAYLLHALAPSRAAARDAQAVGPPDAAA
jgi:hypothetical protein